MAAARSAASVCNKSAPMDFVVLLILIASFAAFITVHVAVVVGLLARRQWWRAPIALVVLPLAPYWARTANMKWRTWIWLVCLLIYVAALVQSLRLAPP